MARARWRSRASTTRVKSLTVPFPPFFPLHPMTTFVTCAAGKQCLPALLPARRVAHAPPPPSLQLLELQQPLEVLLALPAPSLLCSARAINAVTTGNSTRRAPDSRAGRADEPAGPLFEQEGRGLVKKVNARSSNRGTHAGGDEQSRAERLAPPYSIPRGWSAE